MGKGKIPDCIKCGWNPIIPENYEVMEILFKYSNFMVDGMGGLNAQGIDKVLEWENISKEETQKIIQKITIYLTTSLQVQHEEQKHGWQK